MATVQIGKHYCFSSPRSKNHNEIVEVVSLTNWLQTAKVRVLSTGKTFNCKVNHLVAKDKYSRV